VSVCYSVQGQSLAQPSQAEDDLNQNQVPSSAAIVYSIYINFYSYIMVRFWLGVGDGSKPVPVLIYTIHPFPQ
jgi:hypothetical protein